jgi:hypothetical protein
MCRSVAVLAFVTSVASVALLECSPRHYAYAPATTTMTSAELGVSTTNPAMATYAVPSDAPRGEVRVAALGVEDATPTGERDRFRALHVRLVVTNRSDEPWSVNEGQQEVELDARYGRIGEPATPIATTAPRVVQIPPGQTASLDLFFAVPADFDEASKLPTFDVIWTVNAGTRPIMQRTSFERYLVKRPRAATPRINDPTEWNRPFPGRDVTPGTLPGPGQWPPPHPVY